MKLNLACGTDIRDGWVNLDVVRKWPSARRECDHVWDARKDELPFKDSCVEAVYAGYLLLHLAPRHHGPVLQEIWRVMAPGAALMVGEVDMDVVMRRYLEDPSDPRLSELIWGEQGAYEGSMEGSLAEFDKHCQGFTERTLRDLLERHGFAGVVRARIHCAEVFYELTLQCVKP